MLKTKILIAIIIIAMVGAGLYFLLTLTPELPPVPTYGDKEFQGMKYEIIGFIFNKEETNGAVYDIITGEREEGQVKILAEKIIGDIVAGAPKIEEITLLFYSDIIPAGVRECDVARVTWIPNEITVKMIGE